MPTAELRGGKTRGGKKKCKSKETVAVGKTEVGAILAGGGEGMAKLFRDYG